MNNRLLRPTSNYDADALRYINAVQVADGQALEPEVRTAIDAFVRGCKADGIWSAIKASCIMAGARTISGALVPLVGAAPTANNFASEDYDRSSGLRDPDAASWLDSNRANNADGRNDQHMAIYVTVANTQATGVMMGSGRNAFTGTDQIANATSASPTGLVVFSRLNQTNTFDVVDAAINSVGFHGISRSDVAGYAARVNGATSEITRASADPVSDNVFVFDRNPQGAVAAQTDARLAFYSIGSSLDLAALDARVSTLITAIAAALS